MAAFSRRRNQKMTDAMSRPTKVKNLNDVARIAGVTAAAVSLALRDSDQLSAELKARIRKIADEHGYTPRSYRKRNGLAAGLSGKSSGPVLLINNDEGLDDPVANAIIPQILQLSNSLGFELQLCHYLELRDNPALFSKYAGVIFYNDPKGIEIPSGLPAVQIFGWKPLPPCRDRVTANDEQIVDLAVNYLTRNGKITKSVIGWRRDSLLPDVPHPRIERFIERMTALGSEVLSLSYLQDTADVPARIMEFLGTTPFEKCAFFGFNGISGLKLCCALESIGLFGRFGASQVLVCDNTVLLRSFWPQPALIDLNFPVMAERAVTLLLWRLAHPQTPGVLMLQEARLIGG